MENPIIRVWSALWTLVVGTKCLMYSAEIADDEEGRGRRLQRMLH